MKPFYRNNSQRVSKHDTHNTYHYQFSWKERTLKEEDLVTLRNLVLKILNMTETGKYFKKIFHIQLSEQDISFHKSSTQYEKDDWA